MKIISPRDVNKVYVCTTMSGLPIIDNTITVRTIIMYNIDGREHTNGDLNNRTYRNNVVFLRLNLTFFGECDTHINILYIREKP